MKITPQRSKKETFSKYVARRAYENETVKAHLKGRYIHQHDLQIVPALTPLTPPTVYFKGITFDPHNKVAKRHAATKAA